MFNIREMKGLALLLILLLSACSTSLENEPVDDPSVEVLHADLIKAVRDEVVADVRAAITSNSNIVNVVIPSRDDDGGLTALHIAAKYNAASDVVNALIAGGANVNALGENGNTPLIYAAKENTGAGVAAIVAALLGVDGIQVNDRDTQKRTALHWAALQNSKAVVTELVRPTTGASLTSKDTEGWTALGHANARTDLGDAAAKEAFLALVRPEEPTYSRDFIAALGTGDATAATTVEDLLKKDPNIVDGLIPSTSTNGGLTALHVAAKEHASADVVKALIAGGANVNALGESGNTPLIYAAKNTGAETAAIVTALLDEDDSNVDAIESVNSRTALHWAALQNSLAVVQKLIDEGASVALEDDDGETALELANARTDGAKDAVVGALTPTTTAPPATVPYSADLITKVSEGTAATSQTEREAAATAVTTLLDSNPGIVDGLIPSGDDAGLTALHVAARDHAGAEVVAALIDGGANPALLAGEDTPLIYAAKNTGDGTADIVTALLRGSGANVNVQGAGDRTALHWAADGNSLAVVQALIEGGASVALEDGDGETALDLANDRAEGAARQPIIDALTNAYVSALIAALDDGGATAADAVTALLTPNPEIVNERIPSTATADAGLTALHVAARDHAEANVVNALLAKNPDVTLVADGKTAWGLAKARTDVAEAATVIAALKPAYVTALIAALGTGTTDDAAAVTAFLTNNPEIVNERIPSTATADAGLTALHVAARDHAEANVVNALLAKGANPALEDGDGETALNLANDRAEGAAGREAIVTALTNAYVTALIAALDDGGATAAGAVTALLTPNPEIVNELIPSGDDAGLTALHVAARDHATSDVVVALIAKNANAALTDSDGNTPLIYAARHNTGDGTAAIVNALLGTTGANVNVQGAQDRTALHWAALQNSLAVVQKLIEGGASVALEDGDGETALDLASPRQDLGTEAQRKTFLDLLTPDTHSAELIAAVRRGNADATQEQREAAAAQVTTLLESDQDVVDGRIASPATVDVGLTALHIAARDNVASDVVAALLAKDANAALTGLDDSTALMYAARHNTESGTVSIVEALITSVNNVNAVESDGGQTALMLAARYNSAAVVEKLVERGADVTLTDNTPNTPKTALNLANERDDGPAKTAVVEALTPAYVTALIAALDDGGATAAGAVTALLTPNPEIVNERIPTDATKDAGLTALHVAARDHATSDVVTALIAKNANAALTDSDGNTPLILAARHNTGAETVAIVNALLGGTGANVNVQGAQDRTALHWAAHQNTVAVVRALAEATGASLTLTDDGGYTALGRANARSDYADGDAKEAFLDLVTPATATYSGELIAALGTGTTANADAVNALLEKDPNIVNGADSNGLTALHLAAQGSAGVAVVSALLAKGANAALLAAGNTPLILAARHNTESGTVDILEALITSVSNIDTKGAEGNTALHVAARYNSLAVVQKLIEKGANLKLTNTADQTAADLANERENTLSDNAAIVTLLTPPTVVYSADLITSVRKGDDAATISDAVTEVNNLLTSNPEYLNGRVPSGVAAGLTALHVAARYNVASDVVSALIAKGAVATLAATNENTALIYAAQNANGGAEAIVTELLLGLDASDVNAVGVGGHTALHWAALQNSLEVVRALITKGATAELTATNGNTALIYAVRDNTDAGAAIVEALIGANDNINVRGVEGRTALHWAALQNSHAVVQKLVDASADLTLKDDGGYTALGRANARDDTDTDKDAIVTSVTPATATYSSTLIAALGTGDLTANFLVGLEITKDPNSVNGVIPDGDNSGLTALHVAARDHGAADVLRTLIAAGANAALTGPNDSTTLMYAARHNTGSAAAAIVAALFTLVDRNAVESDGGQTALMLAARYNSLAVVRLLAEATDANLKLTDAAGKTAADLANERDAGDSDRQDIIDAVTPAAVTFTYPKFITAIRNGDIPLLTALLEVRTDVVDVQIPSGRGFSFSGHTPLTLAAYSQGNAEVAEFLIEQGANANTLDSESRTALISLAQYNLSDGAESMVPVLIANSLSEGTTGTSNIDAKDEEGRTALMWAVFRNTPKMVRALVRVDGISLGIESDLLDGDGAAFPQGGSTARQLIAYVSVPQGTGTLIEHRKFLGDALDFYNLVQILKVVRAESSTTSAFTTYVSHIDAKFPPGEIDGGLTPLIAAARDNSGSAITLALIAAGADAAVTGTNDSTALMHAARHNTGAGVDDIVTALLGKLDAAGVDAKEDDGGQTALMMAARHNSEAVVTLLVNKGADLTITDKNDQTVLDHAKARPDGGDKEAIIKLISPGNDDLATAITAESLSDVNAIIVAGEASINVRFSSLAGNNAGLTPLMIAARDNSGVDVVNALIAANADATLLATNKNTALIYAAQNTGAGAGAIVTKLLEATSNVNAQGAGDRTALHWAARQNSLAVVRLLVSEQNVDLTLTDTEGLTALDHALERTDTDQAEIVALLGTYSASFIAAIKNEQSFSSHYFAVTQSTSVINAPVPTGQTDAGLTPLMIAARDNRAVDVVNALISASANAALTGPNDSTALMYAARHNTGAGVDAIVTKLLAALSVADVDVTESGGQTALVLAVHYNSASVVTLLVNKGADLTITDNAGNSAFFYAKARADSQDRTSILELLGPYSAALIVAIRAGEDATVANLLATNPRFANGVIPTGETGAGLSPLMIAARYNTTTTITTALIAAGADAGITTSDGWTALMYAVAYNSDVAFITEIAKAANPNVNQRTSVVYTSSTSNLLTESTSITSLYQHGRPAAERGILKGATALVLAIHVTDSPNAVDKINALAKIPEIGPNTRTHRAVAPIAFAILRSTGRVDVTTAVLAITGISTVNIRDERGFSLLAHLADKGIHDVIGLLVNAGTDVDEVSTNTELRSGITPLARAVKEGKSVAVINAFLAHNPDLDTQADTDQRTPLIHAVRGTGGSLARVNALLAGRADGAKPTLDIVDSNGNTALNHAEALSASDNKNNIIAALQNAAAPQ